MTMSWCGLVTFYVVAGMMVLLVTIADEQASPMPSRWWADWSWWLALSCVVLLWWAVLLFLLGVWAMKELQGPSV